MNLFPPEPIKQKKVPDFKKEMDIYNNWITARIHTRQILANLSDKSKIKLAKEILKTEKSTDAKVRKQFYKDTLKKYEELYQD